VKNGKLIWFSVMCCRHVSELTLNQLTYLVLSNKAYLMKIFLNKVWYTFHVSLCCTLHSLAQLSLLSTVEW